MKVKKEQIKSQEKVAVAAAKDGPTTPFDVKEMHQNALLKLLHCHHNGQELTYPQLSSEMGVGEKTKSWQCVAWKDLKGNDFIVPGGGNKTWKLSQKGVELAMTFASDEELAEFKTPMTNEEHHEKIRSKLMRQEKAKKLGPKIFDAMVKDKDTPVTRLELATKVGCKNPDGHGFFYGFKALQNMGLVCDAGMAQKTKATGKKKTTDEEDEEKDSLDEDEEPKKKKPRVRGGYKLFKLTDKAFLASTRQKEESEED